MSLFEAVCERTKVSAMYLHRFSLNAPKKYKVYTIPKRSMGVRTIAQPTPELKKFQRIVVEILEKAIETHSSAYAYKKNTSIKDNALVHVKNDYLLKMDFQNFFNKIKPAVFFESLAKKEISLDSIDKLFLENILFWKPGLKRSVTKILSVGAPSSPLISNIVMYHFDEAIATWCSENEISYSRYADDITFSTNKKNVLFGVKNKVREYLRLYIPGLTINESKTVFSSKAHNRHVTGVTLNNNNEISLGRKRKREISALIHQFTIEKISPSDLNYMTGLISFALHIEPDFVDRMKTKYGEKTISLILKRSS